MKKTLIYVAALTALVLIASGFVNWYQNMNASPQETETETMIALGDSLTYGVGDKSGEGYVKNLEKLIKKEKDADVTVKNYGIPGQETNGVQKQVHLTNVKKDIKNADYIILFIGTNDLIQSNGGDLKEINEKEIEAGEREYEKNLHEILKAIREENKEVPILFLGLFNPYPDSEKLEEVIIDWNNNSQGNVDNYENIKFISTNDLFMEKSKEYFSDSLHPNKKGYDLITKKIMEEYDF
jgi:lysophospholipase L1-like esterase